MRDRFAILGGMASWPPPPAPRAQISRVPYLPGLDGMRAVAVVAVMIYHANAAWLHGGFLGVEVFFVISGYLITLLLIAEHERTDRVRLGQFWLRRARRLLPALGVMLAGLAVYTALFFRRAQAAVRGDFVAAFAYVSNWFQIWVGAGYTSAQDFAPLRHLWSLAVEEQFYLLWPLVMVLILRAGHDKLPRIAMWLAGVSLLITLLVALLYVPGDVPLECSPANMHGYREAFGRCVSVNDTLYLSTLTRSGGLLLGAAFAMVWRPLALLRGPMRRKGHLLDLVALLGIAILGWMMWRTHVVSEGEEFGSRFDPWLYRGGFFVVGLATLMVIAAVTHRRAFAGRLFGTPVLNWIGTRSYGLYLFHWPIYQIIRKEAGIGLTGPKFALAMALTLPITELSYRFVETPIRQGRLREWLHRERRPRTLAAVRRRRQVVGAALCSSFAVGFAGLSIAIAEDRCVSEIECSLRAGEDAQNTATSEPPSSVGAPGTDAPTSSGVTTTADPASTSTTVAGATTSSTTTTSTSTTTTTTTPPANRPPYAIGDSVMQGAVPALKASGFTVDAAQSRQGTEMVPIIQAARDAGLIGKVVVIHAGTNGTVSDATLDAMIAALPPETNLVLFLTVHADRNWTVGNNEKINAMQRYGIVKILDWDAIAGQHPEVFYSDGIHLREEGQALYTQSIKEAIGYA